MAHNVPTGYVGLGRRRNYWFLSGSACSPSSASLDSGGSCEFILHTNTEDSKPAELGKLIIHHDLRDLLGLLVILPES